MGYKKGEREEFLEDQKKIQEHLKENNFLPLYLLYGEEDYLLSYYKKAFFQAFSENEGINCMVVEELPPTDELISAVETLPFFAPYRLMVFEGKCTGRKKLSEDFIQYLKNSPKETVLLFIEEKIDKRSSLYKVVKERGLCLACMEQDQAFLQRFALQQLKKEGKKIRENVLGLLLSRSGSSLYRIVNACKNCVDYIGDGEEITQEAVEAVVEKLPEDRVFDLIEALGRGDQEKVFQYYGDLLRLEEKPAKIQNLIRKNVEKLLVVREYLTEGLREREMETRLSMDSWRVRKYIAQARTYTQSGLQSLFHSLLRLEEENRKGRISDSLALELLLANQAENLLP